MEARNLCFTKISLLSLLLLPWRINDSTVLVDHLLLQAREGWTHIQPTCSLEPLFTGKASDRQ